MCYIPSDARGYDIDQGLERLDHVLCGPCIYRPIGLAMN